MKCSVVIATYNYGLYLPYALDSALDQTYGKTEIVVVDDGSEDNTAEIIKPYVEKYGVVYVYQENAGVGAAKQRAVQESSGELLAFLDADDVWNPTKLEKMIPLFDNPDTAVVYSKRHLIDPDGVVSENLNQPLYRGNVLDAIYANNFICYSSALVRRSCLEAVGGFDVTLPMGIDYDLWIRLAQAYTFDYVDECLTYYRLGHANLSTNKERRMRCAFRIMWKALRDNRIRRKLSFWATVRAWGTTCCTYAQISRNNGRWFKGLGLLAASIALHPLSSRTWKTTLNLMLPDRVYSGLKSVLKSKSP